MAEVMIVFLTGHSSYAIDGYDFHPVGFLTKPIHPGKRIKDWWLRKKPCWESISSSSRMV